MKKNAVILACLFALAVVSRTAYSAGTTVELISLSATSVNFDYMKNGPHNLFDGKPTVWATMPGAGNNEGVMMQFDRPVKITKIQYFSPGLKYAEVKKCTVYADGVDQGVILDYTNPASVDITATTLYIRMIDVEGYEKKEGSSGMLVTSRDSKAAAIDDIVLYDESGKITVVPPRVVAGTLSASSVLTPAEAYTPDYLFDSRRDFGWAEGSSGAGEGEWLEFSFSAEQTIDRIKLWNGYQRSSEHYAANARIRNATFTAGKNQSSLSFKDSSGMQTAVFDKAVTVKKAKLAVDSIYPGSKYKDLVVSEMMFGNSTGYFSIYTGNEEIRKKEIIKKVKNSILQDMIDRSYLVSSDGKDQSFVIRSNGSFVIWIEDSPGPDVRESKVFDGNWEIVAAKGSEAKIRIFGKAVTTTENYDPYAGNGVSSRSAIFSDTLTITADAVKPAKSFDPIRLR